MYCPHCGHLNADGALYCTNCGTRLAGGNPANPAASNPEATASFPRVVPSPTPAQEVGTREARPMAGTVDPAAGAAGTSKASVGTTRREQAAPAQDTSTPVAPEPQERARRVVRSKRPHHNHVTAGDPASLSTEALSEGRESAATQVEPSNATRVVSAEATRVAPMDSTQVAPSPATRVISNDATRVAPAAAQTSPAASPTVAAPPAAPTGAYSQEGYAAGNSQTRKKHGYGLMAGVVVAALAVVLIGVAVFAGSSNQGGDTSGSSSAQQESQSPASTDAGSNAASEPSSNTVSNSAGTTGGTSQKSDATSTDSSTTSSPSAKSSDDANGDASKSGSDLVDNGNGTVSSKTYGYTISMPSQFSQQSGDETGATYYDPADDVTISLWGDNNPTGATMESAYSSAKSSAASGDYVAHGKNWVVYSTDNADSGVVYDMTYYQNGKTCHMHISYPMSSKQAGDAIIEKVQPTFKLNS